MPSDSCPDVVVYVCNHCVPQSAHLARQWQQDEVRVLLREIPCSGKMDLQYLMHALEGGVRGLCVVACPRGDCQLAQGNYRAEIRVGTLHRLLSEIGLEPERAELLHCSPEEPVDRVRNIVHEAVARIAALGESPVRLAANGNGAGT